MTRRNTATADTTEMSRRTELHVWHTLTVDPAVQRDLDQSWVRALTAAWDPDVAHGVKISLRADGTKVILDGQHRRAAATQAGHGADKVECVVYRNLTGQQEARLFRLFNTFKNPNAVDLFRIALTEGDPVAIRLDKLITKHGMRVASGGYANGFRSVKALRRLYEADAVAAERTLDVAVRAWGPYPESVAVQVIDGLGAVARRYGDAVDYDDLRSRLAKRPGGATALLGQARGLAQISTVSVHQALAEIVVNTYNRNRRTRKLPDWRS